MLVKISLQGMLKTCKSRQIVKLINMKNLKFENVSNTLTKAEMDVLKGGYKYVKGDTEGGDTYTGEVWSMGDTVVNGKDQYKK